MKAFAATAPAEDDEHDWEVFATNVGRARLQRREAAEFRLRWMGAIALLLVVVAAGFLAVRIYGIRSGWWTTLIPGVRISAAAHSCYVTLRSWAGKLF